MLAVEVWVAREELGSSFYSVNILNEMGCCLAWGVLVSMGDLSVTKSYTASTSQSKAEGTQCHTVLLYKLARGVLHGPFRESPLM